MTSAATTSANEIACWKGYAAIADAMQRDMRSEWSGAVPGILIASALNDHLRYVPEIFVR